MLSAHGIEQRNSRAKTRGNESQESVVRELQAGMADQPAKRRFACL